MNRKDRSGNNVFEGGFLGLDNIGVFDRSAPLPTGGYLEQADGTAWMALFCQNMLEIAAELALHRPAYVDMALKFVEHFLWIASSMIHAGEDAGMWDEEDGFFYDVLRLPDGRAQRLKVRSMVGLLPLCAVTVFEGKLMAKYPGAAATLQQVPRGAPGADGLHPRPEQARVMRAGGWPPILNESKLRRVLAKMLDENEFLSPYGIRSLSRYHAEHPYVFRVGDQEYRVSYLPAESDTGMFGGNSNWRGPIWMPVNALIIRALLQYYTYYGDDFTVECPTGSGRQMNLYQVAEEIARRLASIFLRDERRPAAGLRGSAEVPGGPALARLPPVLRVLPRRQRGRPRREPPDRMDGDHRPGHAPVRDQHGRAGPRARQGRRHHGSGAGAAWPARRDGSRPQALTCAIRPRADHDGATRHRGPRGNYAARARAQSEALVRAGVPRSTAESTLETANWRTAIRRSIRSTRASG